MFFLPYFIIIFLINNLFYFISYISYIFIKINDINISILLL